MKDTLVSAQLISYDTIRIVSFYSTSLDKIVPYLDTDGIKREPLNVVKSTSTTSITITMLKCKEPLALGHSYFIDCSALGRIPLDVNEAVYFEGFNEEFYYKGNDLGASVKDNQTSFVLWAPLASKVVLKIKSKVEDSFALYPMKREEKGVFRLVLDGNRNGEIYRYDVTNGEVSQECTDPYAKGSTANGEDSVVIDFSLLRKNFHDEALPVLHSPCDAVIYECSVRDMTIDRHTDIESKGTFKGLAERNRKTFGGNPAGFDYLTSLGISHVQLLPIYDFKTVNEKDPRSSYNWGYDPAQYFVPEGSYGSDWRDPFSRIRECQDLVDSFHQSGIRVVMDVVFNHVYEWSQSVFEKVVPGYYFRHRNNGRMAMTSGCGDDLDSERPMVRKLIVDACSFWVETYGIDGYRFDLMGIIDVKTMKEVEIVVKKQKPGAILYGEGWNMGGEGTGPLAHMGNYALLPGYGFFNDRFREAGKKWLAGDEGARNTFKHSFVGSCLNFHGTPMFLSAEQSVNYLECHDNMTFFDFLSSIRGDLSLEAKLDLCKLGICSVLLSFGIPFIHMGQEIGQSKFGRDNTYNSPDMFNRFSYSLLDERKDMYDYCRSLISYRRRHLFLHIYDPKTIFDLVDVDDYGRAIKISNNDSNLTAPYKKIELFLNPSAESLCLNNESEMNIVLNTFGDIEAARQETENALIPPHSAFAICHK